MESFQLVEGRTVLLQIAEHEYRPATIVKVWGNSPTSAVNLVVFLDGTNDDRYDLSRAGVSRLPGGVVAGWGTSRVHGEDIGQWITPQELVSLRAQA